MIGSTGTIVTGTGTKFIVDIRVMDRGAAE
jgi:hypothetical protein